MDSNIIFSSNVYPLEKNIIADKGYISKIFDYARLRDLKNKYFYYPSCNMLSPIQERIIEEGTVCSNAQGDPCWGLEIIDGKYNWTCKCVNTECKYFKKCRPTFDENEYRMFSPKVNNYSAEYRYHDITGKVEDYYPILYSNDDQYQPPSAVVSGMSNNIINKGNKHTIKSQLDVLNAVEINKVKSIIAEEDEVTEKIPGVTKDLDKQDTPIIGTANVNDNMDLNNVFKQFLSVDQNEIIRSSVSDNILVDAGPGTGKTYTLIERINYLVSVLGIEPETLQVLSFTNTAVSEIKTRLNGFVLKGGDRGLRNVDVRTFHSLAWWFLGQANERLLDRGWKPVILDMTNLEYDKSILEAANLINRFPDIISSWNHFIVDEVQDLTGSRARFMLSIIDACLKTGCGFSAFGDSCQAIYDYIKNEDQTAVTSNELYKLLFRKVSGSGRFVRFDKNYRQTDFLIELTKDYRSAILDGLLKKLSSAVAEIHIKIPKLDKSALLLDETDITELSKRKNLCFLCRNNGQTLRLSTYLRKRCIKHIVNSHETIANFAPWIAQLFLDYKSQNITFEQFSDIIKKKELVINEYSIQEAWERIKNLLHTRSEVVDIALLLEGIRSSKVDDPMFRTVPSNKVIVSNIHRAKGREFDQVILDDSFISELEIDNEDIGEYKTLYVALTRPKEKLFTCAMNFENIKPWDFKDGSRRWYTTIKGRKIHIEVGLDNDVSKIIFIRDDINYKRQNYITYNISDGDSIKLKRVLTEKSVRYDILHCKDDSETVIGNMNNHFINDLTRMINPKSPVDYPAFIEDLFVESVYSHIERSDYGTFFPDIKQISNFGVWNWVKFHGMGHLIYDTY